jgi:hypothetical protein
MNLLKFNKIVAVILLSSATVWAARAAVQAPASTTSHRAATLTFHVKAPSTVPNGAGVTCRAVIKPKRSALQGLIGDSPAFESSLGLGIISGSAADCAVEVPAGVTAEQLRDGAVMSYRIDAFTSAGTAFVRTQQDVPVAPLAEALPASLGMNVSL